MIVYPGPQSWILPLLDPELIRDWTDLPRQTFPHNAADITIGIISRIEAAMVVGHSNCCPLVSSARLLWLSVGGWAWRCHSSGRTTTVRRGGCSDQDVELLWSVWSASVETSGPDVPPWRRVASTQWGTATYVPPIRIIGAEVCWRISILIESSSIPRNVRTGDGPSHLLSSRGVLQVEWYPRGCGSIVANIRSVGKGCEDDGGWRTLMAMIWPPPHWTWRSSGC